MSKWILPALLAAGALGGSGGQKQRGPVQAENTDLKGPLPQYDWSRARRDTSGVDWYTYGERPEIAYFDDNRLPSDEERTNDDEEAGVTRAARGGRMRGRGALSTQPRYMNDGPGSGRSDQIAANVSPKEYVMDAETMALLGDGNPDHGADRMDRMRENIRRHKGGALSKGRISPNAKSPEAYLGGRL